MHRHRLNLDQLLIALTNPGVYPHPVDTVEVRQTHLSVVLLAGPYAYKLKKPVNLGFVDFSTLEMRERACGEEVRLNRPFAPGIYHGVVPVVRSRLSSSGQGGVRVGEPNGPVMDQVIEWLVRMERLPSEATLEASLARGELTPALLEWVADRLATFHAGSDHSERVARFGSLESIAENARENVQAARPDFRDMARGMPDFRDLARGINEVGGVVSAAVHERLGARLEATLTELAPLIRARAARGVIRDTHGDLRLEHIYHLHRATGGNHLEEGSSQLTDPPRLVFLDRVEFADRFRYADPIADMAFLLMDLLSRGERELADTWLQIWRRRTGDEDGLALVPFYVHYRAAIRAKVESLTSRVAALPASARQAAQERAARLWMLALGQIDLPARRPCVVVLDGLPGTGKSTLARALADRAGFDILNPPTRSPEAPWLAQLQTRIRAGARIVVETGGSDPGGSEQSGSEPPAASDLLGEAVRLGVPGVVIACQTRPAINRKRLLARVSGSGPADWHDYQIQARARRASRSPELTIDTSTSLDASIHAVEALLAAQGLL